MKQKDHSILTEHISAASSDEHQWVGPHEHSDDPSLRTGVVFCFGHKFICAQTKNSIVN